MNNVSMRTVLTTTGGQHDRFRHPHPISIVGYGAAPRLASVGAPPISRFGTEAFLPYLISVIACFCPVDLSNVAEQNVR
jgi:hypothetical protein